MIPSATSSEIVMTLSSPSSKPNVNRRVVVAPVAHAGQTHGTVAKTMNSH
ncbi:hypothetical protein BH23ACT10_BH23ACT10_35070 [soil metagenome]